MSRASHNNWLSYQRHKFTCGIFLKLAFLLLLLTLLLSVLYPKSCIFPLPSLLLLFSLFLIFSLFILFIFLFFFFFLFFLFQYPLLWPPLLSTFFWTSCHLYLHCFLVNLRIIVNKLWYSQNCTLLLALNNINLCPLLIFLIININLYHVFYWPLLVESSIHISHIYRSFHFL